MRNFGDMDYDDFRSTTEEKGSWANFGDMEYPDPADTNEEKGSRVDLSGPPMPALRFFIWVVDEVGEDGILVRRYYADIVQARATLGNHLTVQEFEIISNPQRFGVLPGDLNGPTGPKQIAEHVLGEANQKSPYISSSDRFPFGAKFEEKLPSGKVVARPFDGKAMWIDVKKLLASGAKLVTADEIIMILREYAKEHPAKITRINNLIDAITRLEGETLILGKVPPGALISPAEYGLYRGARVISVLSFAFTAYDLNNAANESVRVKSIKPLAAEATRQVGGWMGFVIGAKLGAGTSAPVGAFGGPLAPVTVPAAGLIGGFIGGLIGYWAGDMAGDAIYPN